MKIAVLRGVNLELQLLNDSLRSWRTYENGIKVGQQSTKNQSKSNKNLPKFYPGGVWGSFGLIWAPQISFGTDLDTSWGSTLGRFRGQVGVMLEPCWLKN